MLVFFSIGIVQALFSILLIWKKQGLILADKVLMVLLLVLGMEFAYSLLNFEYLPQMPDLIIFPFLVGPLLYLYVWLMTSEERKVPGKYCYHMIPFAIFCVLGIVLFRSPLTENEAGSEYAPGVILIINFLAFTVQSIVYWRLIILRVRGHQRNLEDKISIDSNQVSLNWIRILSHLVFWGFILFFLIDSVFFMVGSSLFEASMLLHVGMLVAIYSISFFGFRQEAVFEGQQFDRYRNILGSSRSEEEESNEEKELKRLIAFLQEEKPYLVRNLTLQDLASAVHIPAYRLSELINKGMHKSFFTLINELRVEEAKRRIPMPEYANLTLTAIGFDSGFNSKSSFHELFKKYAGQTPSQFRKQSQEVRSWRI